MGQRRFQSSTSTTFLTKRQNETIKKNWLSDPATYPMILIMGLAGALVVNVIGSGLLYSPDVQISPQKRGSVVRNYDFKN